MEFIEGKNIVLLIPQKTAEGAFGKRFLSKISSRQDLGQVQFKNFSAKLMTPVSLVYLLQPYYIQYLEDRNRKTSQIMGEGSQRRP
jgi:hypothetical protein